MKLFPNFMFSPKNPTKQSNKQSISHKFVTCKWNSTSLQTCLVKWQDINKWSVVSSKHIHLPIQVFSFIPSRDPLKDTRVIISITNKYDSPCINMMITSHESWSPKFMPTTMSLPKTNCIPSPRYQARRFSSTSKLNASPSKIKSSLPRFWRWPNPIHDWSREMHLWKTHFS